MPVTVNSMTGFARVQGQDGGSRAWVWEIKSVNGRGLEVRTKLPPGFDTLEIALRDSVQRLFQRGNLNLALTFQQQANPAQVSVNEALLEQLIAICQRWHKAAPDLASARLDGLLALRGVLDTKEADESPEDRAAIEAALLAGFREAAQVLSVMRAEEGARLATVLLAHLTEIEILIADIANQVSVTPEAIRERLRQQVQALLETAPSLTEDRLIQEAALLAVKSDVREEIDRLRSHIAAARDLLSGGGAIGRKLDFLCQEFNREANTLCSKAIDVALTRAGLTLKAIIEQFREQVQNIE
jgi:uncharacterized protein (TIGR00255 family)